MRRTFTALLAVLAFALPADAQNQQVRLGNVGDGVVARYDNPNIGVYVGHYGFDFVSGNYDGLGNEFDAWCVDFDHAVSVGNSWWVDFARLNEDLSGTRQGVAGVNAQDRYTQAAWLATQFAGAAQSEWGAIHAAIWNIMGSGPTGRDADNGNGYTYWVNQAQDINNYGSVDLSRWAIMTHYVNDGSGAMGNKQEFLVQLEVVPEPGTVILLATGLLGIFVYHRRRERLGEDSDLA